MASIGLIVHEFRNEAEIAARSLVAALGAEGHDLRVPDDGDSLTALDVDVVSPTELPSGLDLMISLGGDGSMLRAVSLVADAGVPIMGANFGQLGYLTEFEPETLMSGVHQFLAGNASIEERMRVQTQLERHDGQVVATGNGLNEAIVEKVQSGRTVRLDVAIDGEVFTRYSADGVIVATPTGSTAYSLSARGPIVAPDYETLIVTAVAPHMLFDRSLVLNPRSEVTVTVVDDRPASLSIDGRGFGTVEPGDVVRCSRSQLPARFVLGADRSFLGVLKTKFGLPDNRSE